ncbi:MAG TPA: hypothetical protein VGK59_11200 [Ohtaekwangia sp.]
MNIKLLYSLLLCGLFTSALLSCGSDDDDDKTNCNTFSTADSVCFCTANPEDANCITVPEFTEFTISLYTEEEVGLTPHPSNGTLWTKGFVIDGSIYLIDRESDSPHGFWKFDIEANDTWEEKADFPGTGYGLTGSANGKGYASSYASNKFWEYDPGSNQWTPMTDLPFATGETHWVEYKGKFYVPDNTGIYEFNATTKEWNKFSEQTSSGFGAIFLLGDDMYWWDINDEEMSHLNLATKAYETIDLHQDFNHNTSFNSPFVLGNTAYVISSNTLWVFDNTSKTWSPDEEAITEGNAYVDDVFVIDTTAYVIDNGYLKVFEGVE